MTPSDIIQMVASIGAMHQGLENVAASLTPGEVEALRSMTFEPCGTPNCTCHTERQTLAKLILSIYDTLPPFPGPSLNQAPLTSKGLDSQALTQNREYN